MHGLIENQRYVLKKYQQEFVQIDYFHTNFMNSGTPQMRPDKCRIGFYLEARHPIIIKVNRKQKSYYLNTELDLNYVIYIFVLISL